MNKALSNQPVGVEIDVRALVKSLVRVLPYVFVFVGLVAGGLYFGLSQIAPQYRAQATLLIETGESEFARTTSAIRTTPTVLEQEAVASQVQLLQSRDLARVVAQKLNLEMRAEFNPELRGNSYVSELLAAIGLGRDPASASVEERVIDQFEKNLSVQATERARPIIIEFASQDPNLAASGANAVAEEYIAIQRTAKRDTTADAAAWLETEIGALRAKVQEAEAKVAHSLSHLKSDAAKPEGAGVDLRALESEAAAQRELLNSYLRRYQEALARQPGGNLTVEARILSRASVPASSYFPKTGASTGVAAAAALLLAIAFILMREMRSGRHMRGIVGKTIPAIRTVAPVQGQQRWDDDGDIRRMMPAEPSFAPKAEERTNEALSAVVGEILASRRRRIMVMMAEDSDRIGRPLAAVAIARAIARADRRPVLIDLRADGANSASMGGGTDLPGFSDLFAGEASFAQVIFRDRKSRVHFIPGGLHPLAADELDDDRISPLLSALDHTYDHVILDVAADGIAAVGVGCDAAVVVSEFAADDPRTIRAFERVNSAPGANVILFVVDSTVAEDAITDDLDAAEGAAA